MIINSGYPGPNVPSKAVMSAGLAPEATPEELRIAAWRESLGKIKSELKSIEAGSEGQFLSIASRLSDFHGRAGAILDMTSSVAGMMSSPAIKQTIERLNALLGEMQVSLRRSETATGIGLEKLNDIHAVVQGVELPVQEFRSITKSLRVHAISTRLQSASLGQNDHGFHGLAQNIKELSETINKKSQSVSNSIVALFENVDLAIGKVKTLKSRQKVKVRVILDETTSCILSLTEKYEICARAASDTATMSKDISQKIWETVTSLQFHDIFRQELGRTNEGFAELLIKLNGRGNGGQGNGDNGGTGLAAAASLVTRFCTRQAVEINRAALGFVSAVKSIIENLGSVALSMSDMLEGAKGMTGESGNSFLTDVQDALTSVRAALEAFSENEEAAGEISEAIMHIAEKTAEMVTFIEEIEEIGQDVQLVALNAGIKAEHIGDAGKPLGVLAASVQKLSVEAAHVTESTSRAIGSILNAAEDLIAVLHIEIEGETMDVEALGAELGRMATSLGQVNRESSSLLRDIHSRGRHLHLDLKSAAGSIGVHKLVRGVMDRVMSGFNNTALEARAFAANLDDLHEETGEVSTEARFDDKVELF